MDTRLNYLETIKKILTDFTETYIRNGGPRLKILCDDEQKSYMLLNIGWRGNKYIHSATVHIEIIDNKIWIQNDHTEEGIAAELVEAGIPKENIVLGFVIPKYGSTPNLQQQANIAKDRTCVYLKYTPVLFILSLYNSHGKHIEAIWKTKKTKLN